MSATEGSASMLKLRHMSANIMCAAPHSNNRWEQVSLSVYLQADIATCVQVHHDTKIKFNVAYDIRTL